MIQSQPNSDEDMISDSTYSALVTEITADPVLNSIYERGLISSSENTASLPNIASTLTPSSVQVRDALFSTASQYTLSRPSTSCSYPTLDTSTYYSYPTSEHPALPNQFQEQTPTFYPLAVPVPLPTRSPLSTASVNTNVSSPPVQFSPQPSPTISTAMEFKIDFDQRHCPGCYNFRVAISNPPKITKGAAWVYNKERGKLFAQRGVSCPIQLQTDTSRMSDPESLLVKVTSLFTEVQNRKDVVKACPTHRSERIDKFGSLGDDFCSSFISPTLPSSLVVSTPHQQSSYYQVLIPICEPSTRENLVFSCLNTCIGGPNRRRTSLLFTLHRKESGEILGHELIEVKICSCPGRDAEKDFNTPAAKAPSSRKRSLVDTGTSPVNVKRETTATNQKSITVSDQNCDLLTLLRDAIEISSQLPPNQRRQYLQENEIRDTQLVSTQTLPRTFVDRASSPILTPNTRSQQSQKVSTSQEIKPCAVHLVEPPTWVDSESISIDTPDVPISEWLPEHLKVYADDFAQIGFENRSQLPLLTMKDLNRTLIGYDSRKQLWRLIEDFKSGRTISSNSVRSQTSSGESIGLFHFQR